MKPKNGLQKTLIIIFVSIFILFFAGCVRFISLSGCTGGIDGYTFHLSDEERLECVKKFPNHRFNYSITWKNDSFFKDNNEIFYPQFTILNFPEVQDKINIEIKNKIDDIIIDFDNWKLKVGRLKFASSTHEEVEGNIEIKKEIFEPEEIDVISIEFSEVIYIKDVMHPRVRKDTLNFDITTGKLLQIEDVFLTDRDYLRELSRLSIEAIKEKGGEAIRGRNGQYLINSDIDEFAKKEHFDLFYFLENNIVFIFDSEDLGLRHDTFYSITIPYKDLKYLNKKVISV